MSTRTLASLGRHYRGSLEEVERLLELDAGFRFIPVLVPGLGTAAALASVLTEAGRAVQIHAPDRGERHRRVPGGVASRHARPVVDPRDHPPRAPRRASPP